LTAESKLDEAAFFFDKMNKASLATDEWRYYFSAFLGSIRSVPYHLLYDYAEKYGLGYSLEDRIYPKDFKNRANAQNNQQALSFIRWYKSEWDKLSQNNVVKAIIGSRDIDVHRGIQPLQSYVDVGISLVIGNRVDHVVRDSEGRVIQRESSSKTASPNPADSKVTTELPNLPGMHVHDACKKMLDLMRDFVREAHKSFP